MFGGKMPQITSAQVVAVITFVVGQIVAWGYVNNSQGQTLISAGSTLVAVALKLADAFLRGKRVQAVAQNPDAFK